MVVSCINKLQVLPTGFVACPARTVCCLLAVAAMAKQPLSMPCKTSSIIWASRIKRQVRTSASASTMPKTLPTSAKCIPKIGGHSWRKDILAIDDLGTEPREIIEYGNVLSPIIDLISYRYEHQLPTIITSNLTPQQISELYGKRIGDRLKETTEIVPFLNGSYRG